MLNRILSIIAVLTLSCFALAQQNSGQQSAVAPGPNSTTTCAVTFTSGSGHNATQYCVTVNGNVIQFSRGGDEYIQVGGPGEGYGICDLTSNIAYYDYGFNESGNWLPSTLTTTLTQAISTRLTSDGIWQITNTITKVAANATGPGAAKVSMKIKNLTGVNRSVYVVRQADVDFLRNGVSDFTNDFDYTIDTVSGLEPGFKTGLSLTTNTFSFAYDAFAQNVPGGPNPCNPAVNLAAQPFVGDGSVVQLYVLTVPKLGTKTITMTYKPI